MGVKARDRKWTYRYFAFVLLTLLISSSLAVAAFGGQFEDAMAAIERGDYTTAFRLMKPLAEQGEAEAQFHLGVMYTIGKGVPRDYTGGVKWFRRSAEQGNVDAQSNLGVLYSSGKGVPRDYAEAVKWFQRAAEQGNEVAQFHLGVMYSDGKGIPKGYAEAVKWFRRAAEQGFVDAQFNLGAHYASGIGVPQDYVSAHMWYNLAASRYSASERKYQKEAKKSRDRVASKMTPAQIAEAQRMAREWKPKKEVK